MKKLLLIPSLALTAITPVIAMTSCDKDNGKKNGIVWDEPYKANEKFFVFSNKLDTTAWLFEAEGSDIECTSSGGDRIDLEISYESLKEGIVDYPAQVSCNFSISIHGKKISYQWNFLIAKTLADSKADRPKIRN